MSLTIDRDVDLVDPFDLGMGRLLDQIQDAVIVGEAVTQKIVVWNAAASEMFGYPREEAIGKPIHFLVPARLQARHRAGIARFASTGEGSLMLDGTKIEVPAVTASGEEIQIELSLSSIGSVRVPGRYVLAIARDLTHHSEAPSVEPVEEADHLRTMDQLLEDLPVGVFVIDRRTLKPFYANKAALRILGEDALPDVGAKELGQRYKVRMAGTDKDALPEQRPIARALRGERDAKAEMILTRGSRETLLNVTATPLLGDDGEVRCAVVTFDDITDQRAIETRFQQLHKMESLGQVTAGVAHNFNNLLAVILNFVEFALEELPEGSTGHADLKQAQEAAQRGAELVSNLMSYLKQRPLRFESIDISDAVVRVRGLLQSLLGAGITMDIEGLTPGAWTRFDNGEVLNILVNLAANARHSMGNQGALTLSVDVVDRLSTVTQTGQEVAAGRFVHLSVADTGEGIPDNVQERIFDPFFTTKDPTQGTGLGLSTVLTTIESAGGAIEVDSKAGVGTTFHIYLPAEA